MNETETDATIALATQLLELIHNASTTTTYKYALLLALIDLCQENVGRREGPTGSVSTRQVAARVIELYWIQTRPHVRLDGKAPRQLTRDQRSIPSLIEERRRQFSAHATTPYRARLLSPDLFEDLMDDVEWILIRYPIPLLQRLGCKDLPLIYEIHWREQPPRSKVMRYQRGLREGRGDTSDFDNLIRFFPGTERRLATLASLLRPLIRREWTRFVAQCNGDELEDLEQFLFEPEREGLSACRQPLAKLQSGACFYCGDIMSSQVDVDHFLPWSRCTDDGLHNLVATHPRCNSNKSDHLAAEAHVSAWRMRLDGAAEALRSLASVARLPFEPDRSLRLARALYSVLPRGSPLWLSADQFEGFEPPRLLAVLG
jgi:hypothetical protein